MKDRYSCTPQGGALFIGGIHGGGKSTLGKRLKSDFPDLNIFKASTLLKLDNIKDKHIKDIRLNQHILESKIGELKNNYKFFILEGHFCLSDNYKNIEYVGLDIFYTLNPKALVLIKKCDKTVRRRLIKRDNIKLSLHFISRFNKLEQNFARFTSENLKVPLYILHNVTV